MATSYHGIGRRKSSVARVWLQSGKGNILINGRKYKNYFDTDMSRLIAQRPLNTVSLDGKYDIQVNVRGGGQMSQAGAMSLGLARALLKSDEKLRPSLKKNRLLHCDARVKERKKYGQKGARRKFQFVKR